MGEKAMQESRQDELEDVTEQVRERWTNGPLAKRSRAHKIPRFHMPWREQILLLSARARRTPGNLYSTATWRFPVVHEYLNPGNSLHGAAQTLFYDNTMAYLFVPLAKPGFWDTYGFSRTLSVTYLAQVREGDWVRLEVETVQVGKRMALLKGRMWRESDGVVVSTCEHDKFTTDARAAKI